MIAIHIPGQPVAKGRPRHGKGRTYTPKKTMAAEKVIAQEAALRIKHILPPPIKIMIFYIFEPPKSWSKKKRAAHLHMPHTQKPDLDNLDKLVLDGLQGIAFADDSQVAEKESRKVWGVKAHTIIIIENMEEP